MPRRGLLLCCLVLWLAACSQTSQDSEQSLSQGLQAARAGDYAEAYWHWRDLADAGDAEAQFQIGWLHANGNGLRVNPKTAIDWWQKAAASGHVEAKFAIGMTYLNGEHKALKRDFGEALKWLVSAADQGSEDAAELVLRLLRARTKEVLKDHPELLSKSWLGDPVQAMPDARLREKPSTKAADAGPVPKGGGLREISREKGWVKVVDPGGGGFAWIRTKSLIPTAKDEP